MDLTIRPWMLPPRQMACRRPDAGACSVLLDHHSDGGGRGRDMARVGAIVERRRIRRVLLRVVDELRMILDEACAELARAEVGAVQDRAVVVDCGRRTDHNKFP